MYDFLRTSAGVAGGEGSSGGVFKAKCVNRVASSQLDTSNLRNSGATTPALLMALGNTPTGGGKKNTKPEKKKKKGGGLRGKTVLLQAVCRRRKCKVTDPEARKETQETWDAMDARQQTRYNTRAAVLNSQRRNRAQLATQQRSAPEPGTAATVPVGPSASTSSRDAEQARTPAPPPAPAVAAGNTSPGPLCLASYRNSVARDNPNPQEGCEGLGAVVAHQEAPTTSTRRITYGALTPSTSLSRFEKVLNESFKGSLRQASASFDEKAGGLVLSCSLTYSKCLWGVSGKYVLYVSNL